MSTTSTSAPPSVSSASLKRFIQFGVTQHKPLTQHITLTDQFCHLVQSPVPPQYVFWYHNARMINYDEARGVTVVTKPGPKTQSALAIRSAAPAHSGNYTCAAANTEPAHIYVYVSEGSRYHLHISLHCATCCT